jgi:Tol biopolymer transport system component
VSTKVLRVEVFVVALAVVVIALAAAVPDRAQASFPGENGRFVFDWTFDTPEGVGAGVLATANRAGGDLRVLRGCDYGCNHGNGDWSPSGHRLVYVDACDECMNRLVVMGANGRHRKAIHVARDFFLLSSPAWSPDGSRIAFVEWRWSRRVGHDVSDIFVIRRDGTDLTRLTRDRKKEWGLDWSTRNRLVFARGAYRRSNLFTMRPNGQALRQLTVNRVAEHDPEWAPGGKRLTFTRDRQSQTIWTMKASGENARRIASGHSPAWAPDRTVIAFIGTDGAIHTVKPSGDDNTLIGTPVSKGGIWELDWQARHLRP